MRTLLAVLLALSFCSPTRASAQSPLRVSVGGAGGAARSIGDTRASYGSGWFGWGDLAFRRAGSRLSLRVEAIYLRLRGARSGDVFFPAVNLLAFSAGAVRNFGAPERTVAPYIAASVGAYNAADALPFAGYRTGAGIRGALGATARVGPVRLFAEGGLTNIFGPGPHTLFSSLLVGIRAGRP